MAREAGEVVVVPAPDELLIDIDNAESMASLERVLPKFKRFVAGVKSKKVRPSKSGEPGKSHVTIVLKRKITADERILFQLMLGSDPVREVLSYARLKANDPVPTLFIEKIAGEPAPHSDACTPKDCVCRPISGGASA